VVITYGWTDCDDDDDDDDDDDGGGGGGGGGIPWQLDAKYNISGKVSNGLSSGFVKLSQAVNNRKGSVDGAPRGAGNDTEEQGEAQGAAEEATTTSDNPYRNF